MPRTLRPSRRAIPASRATARFSSSQGSSSEATGSTAEEKAQVFVWPFVGLVRLGQRYWGQANLTNFSFRTELMSIEKFVAVSVHIRL